MRGRASALLMKDIRMLRGIYSGFCRESSKNILKYSLLGAVIFGMAAHAFAYLNFAPMHDAVNYIAHLAGGWEVSLGRFFQPLYGRIRGEYQMPWMSGMLSMLYIGLSAFLICDLFDVEETWIAMLIAGFLSANATMTNLIMAFAYVTDVFAFALLLACIGAFAIIRISDWLGIAIGSGCFAVSMGLYQSYVVFGGLILVSYTMLQAMSERDLLRKQAGFWIRCILAVALTAAVYLVFYRYFIWSYRTGVASASSYNSPARLASLDLMKLLPLFGGAYESFLEYFLGVGCDNLNLIQMGTIALCLITGALLMWYAGKEKLPLINLLLIGLGILVFPGAAQVISVLANHSRIYFLTTHALYLMYPLMLGMLLRIHAVKNRGGGTLVLMKCRGFQAGIWLVCSMILFGNIRFSNEIYTFRSVQYDKTLSYVTRLMERIDSVPGYVRNETEVIFTGYMSAGLSNLKEPEGSEWMEGINRSSVTYLMVLRSFIHMLGEEMNIPLDYSDLPDYGAMQEVKDMPAFPNPGCSRMIDGRVLVKLLDN